MLFTLRIYIFYSLQRILEEKKDIHETHVWDPNEMYKKNTIEKYGNLTTNNIRRQIFLVVFQVAFWLWQEEQHLQLGLNVS